jgi:NADH dehydrogenase
MKDKKHIVILGAGYAGVQTAKLLSKKFKKNENVEITLIDKKPYHTLMTELHEVAGARVEQESVQINLKKVFSATKVDVVTEEIRAVDFKSQSLDSENNHYEYDYLVVGMGSEPAFFGVPGVQENGLTLWSMEDALKINEHIENMFRKACNEKNIELKREMLTFVVAGAGFTGIELVGELIEWKKKLCKKYFVEEKDVKLMVVEALGKILPILNDKLIAKSARYLRKNGVEVLTNTPICQVDKNSITVKDGSSISTQTLIWTCGVQGNSFAAKLGLTLGKRGRVQVNEFMQSSDYKNVYVVGDNSYFEENSKPIAQIVEIALQTAETATHNIIADIDGGEKKGFVSNTHGMMVSIGSRYAVASLMGVSLSGFLAMAMKHLVNCHYLWGVGGVNTVWAYIKHEFFDTKEKRTMLGGHLAAKVPTFWIVLLRMYVGVLWLIEGINKVKDGWLNPNNIYIVSTAATSGASETGGEAVANAVVPLLSQPPAFYTWFMDTFVAPFAFIFQATVVIMEIGIGLALIGGLFTFLASLASIFMSLNFILSAMAGKEILWYIFAGIALMGGAGRAFGLDYYVMPWIKKWWNNTKFARKTYLFID